MQAAVPRAARSSQLLQEYLAQDVVPREVSIARFMRGMVSFSCVAALLLVGPIGWKLSLCLAALTGALSIYYTLMLRALREGGFHPAMQWVDSALTVSIPAVVFLADVYFNGAVYALTTPPAYAWGTLIVVCALRTNRYLAYFAAGLAALEYLLLYLLVALPRLPPGSPDTLELPMVFLRCMFLFSYGPLTATLGTLIMNKAGDALRAIREKDVMGKYFLHERLGVGGMAEVFRATYSPEGGFEKQVAIKRVLPAYADNEEFLALFRREAELGSLLNHPNIVQVLDLGRHQGTVFLALEYVDGLPLSTLLQRVRRLPPAAVAYIGAEMALALAYMHGRTGRRGEPLGLVHRDLNPPNILLSRIGEVKLSDFGVARAAKQLALTRAQTVRGKAGYMAPEQAHGLELDGRADLFSLGLTLYEALTGQPALHGETDAELMIASTQQDVPPPSHLVPGLSPALDAIIAGLLRRDLEQRTRSAEVLGRQFLALPGAEAPYVHGQRQLLEALREATTQPATPVQPLQLTPDMALTEAAEALPAPHAGRR
ncbi:Serine/threonine protein kinase PrkC, regulator of stationary phase [Cystobacter fuscus DSM 2262]|uniref:Serine/threonine protein kinase PrkC, regulator of stationary phase n=1 Tax=Cystobacter fuscus (strain ATCC 25194 / DSM 2262 / NBRC 100088 / M29) TaxID=1242864 RepID=S9PEF4_CYSF2|nr:serine/threonine-protein kinase [Cystobacter fuscus]EPX61436.1 Serine/threonine protein kinase PrkC, regulator of stationary phase [Cystobacter fuscus DSM 2262]